MFHRAASISLLALLAAAPASAANLPAIKSGKDNPVPACATPGRLMAYVKSRNDKVDQQFDGIATEYMRHGEALGVRWDLAFFQMLVETGNLTFKGDVRPRQNNFAGLGATGGGEPGETFKDVSTGARAHLEHVLMYAGEQLVDPVAERTRKVQEWGVLTSWQKSIKGPMTFTHLTRKWSPKDRGYSKDIASVAERFMANDCRNPDPRPELVAEARGASGTAAVARDADLNAKVSGAELARRAIEDARASGEVARSGLGANSIAAAAKPQPAFTILNAPKAEAVPPTSIEPVAAGAAASLAAKSATSGSNSGAEKSKPAQTVAAASQAAASAAAPQASTAASVKCRVWQASYGGAKAVIIKAGAGAETNYTVLDVNEGAEKVEAQAYITAYAKGGESVGEFADQAKALDKAFELCPEG